MPTSQPRTRVTTTPVTEAKHGSCLEDSEYADYPRKNKNNPILTEPASDPFTVRVYNAIAGEKTRFEIANFPGGHYHPVELRACGVYIIRSFGLDKSTGIYKNHEFWKYTYDGNGSILLPNNDFNQYSLDFRVDPKENYIALVRGYLGKDDYALIIKDLKTIQDIFTLPIQEIEKRNPDLVAEISFESGGWADNSRYFWARTHDGANVLGFIRIDMHTKTFDLFPAPKDMLGGDAVNVERGLVTVHPGNVWYGIAQIADAEKARRRAQGMGTELYIYNLVTKQRQLIISTTEPLYYFQPRWLSSTTLQYKLLSGATSTYTIPQ